MKIITPIVAIIVLGLLSAFALSKGINGVLFGSIAAIIGGLAGYTAKGILGKPKSKE